MAAPEAHKQAEIDSRTPDFIAAESTKPFGWETYHWVRWATIAEVLRRLSIPRGARILDVGSGSGWTSLFLAESGYDVTAVDLVPANVELTADRAARWGVTVTAQVADMEELDVGGRFGFVLIHDALHHSRRHDMVLERARAHLNPAVGCCWARRPGYTGSRRPPGGSRGRRAGPSAGSRSAAFASPCEPQVSRRSVASTRALSRMSRGAWASAGSSRG